MLALLVCLLALPVAAGANPTAAELEDNGEFSECVWRPSCGGDCGASALDFRMLGESLLITALGSGLPLLRLRGAERARMRRRRGRRRNRLHPVHVRDGAASCCDHRTSAG